jgi:hypothetical protein
MTAAIAQDPAPNNPDSPPNNAELRSAYCIPVVQDQIQMARNLIGSIDNAPKEARQQAEQMRPRASEHLARMQGLLAKLQASVGPAVIGSPVADAQSRGAKDLEEYRGMDMRCTTKCYAAGPAINKCQSDCRDTALIARIEACLKPG